MFSGKEAALRPILDALLTVALGLGPDVTMSPVKTLVPLYRRRVLARVKPATQARVAWASVSAA